MTIMFSNCGKCLILLLIFFNRTCTCQYSTLQECIASSLNSVNIFSPTSNELCNSQVKLFTKGIQQSQNWALQLKDASTTSVNGLLDGETFHLGHFDNCIYFKADKDVQIRGKYCLLTLQLDLEEMLKQQSSEPLELINASIADKMVKRRDIFHVGVCIPHGCDHQDIEASFRRELETNDRCNNIVMNVTVPREQCSVAHKYEWNSSNSKIIFWSILLVLSSLVLLSSFAEHIFPKSYEHVLQALAPFSVVKNLKALSAESKGNSLAFLDFIKVGILVSIIGSHRFNAMVFHDQPVQNMKQLEDSIYNTNYFIFHSAGTISNDILLCMGGFTLGMSLLKSWGKRTGHQFFTYASSKLVKQYPAFLFTLAFVMYILPDISDGPFWSKKVLPMANSCQKNWWTNALFIHNYVRTDDMCVPTSWYVAPSNHLMIALILVASLTQKRPRIFQLLLVTAFVATVAMHFKSVYLEGLPPTFVFDMKFWTDPGQTHWFTSSYLRTSTRSISFLVGVLGAYLMKYVKASNYHVTPMVAAGSLITAVVLILRAIIYSHGLALDFSQNSPFENAVISTFLIILVPLIGMTNALIMSTSPDGLGAMEKLVRSKVITAMSRLSLWVSLINLPILQIIVSSSRSTLTFSAKEIVWRACGDTVIIYLLSLFLYLSVEVPLNYFIDKFLFGLHSDSSKKKTN